MSTSTRMRKPIFDALNANAMPNGAIAAAAMDQRGSLKRALEGAGARDVSDQALSEFKVLVSQALTPHASAILLDPSYGLDAGRARHPDCGLLYAYERSGYDTSSPGRQPGLLDGWSVQRLAEQGATGIKVLVYYDPTEDAAINDRKHAFVERIGAECEAEGIPYFLETLTYCDRIDDRFEWAKAKPAAVRDTMTEFAKPQYRVHVQKVELPFDPSYLSGLSHPVERVAYEVEEARDHLRAAAEAARQPFIYLSAGVDMRVFAESLELAADAGTGFNGVLCGRATWKGSIPVYAQEGADAMRAWLEDEGVRNIQTLNATIERCATPWWAAFGGRDALDLVP